MNKIKYLIALAFLFCSSLIFADQYRLHIDSVDGNDLIVSLSPLDIVTPTPTPVPTITPTPIPQDIFLDIANPTTQTQNNLSIKTDAEGKPYLQASTWNAKASWIVNVLTTKTISIEYSVSYPSSAGFTINGIKPKTGGFSVRQWSDPIKLTPCSSLEIDWKGNSGNIYNVKIANVSSTPTPTPTPVPTITPTPIPTVTPTPIPISYNIPPALRIVSIANDEDLLAAKKDLRPGDRLVFQSGTIDNPTTFSRLELKNLSNCGNSQYPIVLCPSGDPLTVSFNGGTIIDNRGGNTNAHDFNIVGLKFTDTFFIANGANHNSFVYNEFNTSKQLTMRHGIQFTSQDVNPGNNLFLRNKFIGPWKEGDPYGGPSGMIWLMGEPVGADTTIAYNDFHGWKDAIGTDESASILPTSNLWIIGNKVWLCNDDLIQIENIREEHTIIENNILGGSKIIAQNGIATAPYGTNMIIRYNSVSGYLQSGLKLNTGVGGICNGLDAYNNTFVGLGNDVITLTLGGNWNMTGIIMHNNTLIANRRVINAESRWDLHNNFSMNGNNIHVLPTSVDKIAFWWVWDTLTNSKLKLMNLSSVQKSFGWELNGSLTADTPSFHPVQVLPNVPVEYLCTWEYR